MRALGYSGQQGAPCAFNLSKQWAFDRHPALCLPPVLSSAKWPREMGFMTPSQELEDYWDVGEGIKRLLQKGV